MKCGRLAVALIVGLISINSHAAWDQFSGPTGEWVYYDVPPLKEPARRVSPLRV